MNRKPWTDEEDGMILDNIDRPAGIIAAELGRTVRAIYQRRNALKSGRLDRTSLSAPKWTAAEDRFMLANPHMALIDIANHLGRSVEATKSRRSKVRKTANPGMGRNFDPFRVGGRPLLARTCGACGLLLHAKWFAAKNGSRLYKCSRCQPKYSKVSSNLTGIQRFAAEKMQALSLPLATKHGQPWTESEFDILRNPDLTIFEKALACRRTYWATSGACHVNEFKSKRGLGDPERDQWIIDNPNAGNVDDIAATITPPSPLAPAEAKQPTAPQWDWDESDLKVSA